MDRPHKIELLSPAVVNQIAAGEVIERPASVLKELLENSIDALASRITIDIEEGGMELIRVADDGEGIPPEELPLAVTSHATSKLKQADDLFRVQTMGFRGEALASIAEVSQFRISSRVPDSMMGSELSVLFGQRSEIRPTGCAPGTQIEIRKLFHNTPVRRKFLKKPGTEFGYIAEHFTRLALAHPRLDLTLTHQQKTVHRLPGGADLRTRLLYFFGSEVVDKMIPIEAEQMGIRLWGYVGHPSQHKATRKSQYLFLNGRFIQDRSLQHALTEAYRGLLMSGRYPISFLFLEMPSEQVDVNVHPTKAEVRFRDPQQIFRLLLSTLRSQFLKADLQSQLALPSGAKASPEETRDKQRKVEQDLVSWARSQLAHQVTQQFTAEPTATAFPQAPVSTMTQEYASEHPVSHSSLSAEGSDSPLLSIQDTTDLVEERVLDSEQRQTPTPAPTAKPAEPVPVHSISSGVPALQVDDCYLVLSTDQGLTVIDQHALHERVLYERFRKTVLSGSVEVQKLLIPLTFPLEARKIGLLLEHQDLLAEMGFDIGEFGGDLIAVNSHPVFLGRNAIEATLLEFADRFEDAEGVTRRDLLDSALHMMACKAAIKAGQRLTTEEILALLAQRDEVDDAHHCPHGRPTALVLSREDLDRQFGRLGI
ncbi:MAG: DNA mismatch repair endonuclease MutL [Planctomycetaceae bacterium]|nr:DNA mismatch repair endonuclease MutL [Planctomycetaceae bacterium]